MSNTIKLKRGSGSDPSASDLVVGELAIRTDNGKIFTKKDNGSVAEISGSGGGNPLTDGDKGDITVSNGGDTFTIDNGVVTSAKIADGTIVNADISGSAAIAGSKLQAAGLVNAGSMSAANFNKLAGIEANATADMTGTEILATISGENIILGEIASTGNSTFAGNVTLSSSDGGSAAAPELDLYRVSASPADADYLGQIKFSGESDDDSKQVYAKITGKIGDASSGTEDGIIEIAHRKAGSNNISARFTSTDLKLINGTGLEVAGNTVVSGDIEPATNGSGNIGNNGTGSPKKFNRGFFDSGVSVSDSSVGFTVGTSFDTRFYHNGSGTHIDHAGTGNILVRSNNGVMLTGSTSGGKVMANFTPDDAVDLYFAGSKKFETTNTGTSVTGNIVVSGTVDGVDIATRDTLFGGLTSSSGVLTNGVTATTQGASDNTTKVATTAYVTTAISNLINNAPSALDTLKELSDALGSDANFSTTVTNSLATKLPLAGGTLTGSLDFGNNVRARFGNSQQLQILFDGNNPLLAYGTGTLFATGSNFRVVNNGVSENIIWAKADAEVELYYNNSMKFETTNTGVYVNGNVVVTGNVDGRDVATDGTKLDGIESNATADQTAAEIKTLLNSDGIVNAQIDANAAIAGTKIDPDFGSQNIQTTGQLQISSTLPTILLNDTDSENDFEIRNQNGSFIIRDIDNPQTRYTIASSGMIHTFHGAASFSSNLDVGAGVDVTGNITVTGTVDGRDVATDGSKLDGIESNATADQTASEILSLLVTVDGSGSGLDADTLDGIGSSAFVRSDANDTMNGNYVVTGSGDEKFQLRGTNPFIRFQEGATDKAFIQWHSDGYFRLANQEDSSVIRIKDDLDFTTDGSTFHSIFHEGNLTVGDGGLTQNNFTNTLKSKLDGIAAGATNVTNNNQLTNGAGYITSADGGNAASADTIDVTSDGSAPGTSFLTFVDNNGSGKTLRLDSGLTYVPATNVLTAGTFNGSGASLTSLNASNLSSGTIPDARFPSTLPAVDGSNLTGISAGATGGGTDEVFYENGQTVTTNYTITNGKNAMAAGPIQIQNGVTVTVGSGENLTIV